MPAVDRYEVRVAGEQRGDRHTFVVRDAAGEEHYGEVVVTGPNESPDALGRLVATGTG